MSLNLPVSLLDRRCMQRLEQIQMDNLYRTRLSVEHRQGALVQSQQQTYLSFNSNDYLGHAQHPFIQEAFKKSVLRYGVGSGGSPLLGGHHAVHEQLEEEVAEFVGMPRALLFSTGYSANLSTLISLIQSDDYLFQDRLNHASLMDAARYTQSKCQRYQHGNMGDLERRLERCAPKEASFIWLATDGVFSVDGDLAPLDQLVRLKQRYGAGLIVDDAHGIGVLGESGSGSADHFQVKQDITLLTGSFGIAVGTFGAFVAGSELLIETLLQCARGYIYTTAFPPALAEATRVSLQLLKVAESQRHYLKGLIHYFRTCAQQLELNLAPSMTPIQPILIGDNASTQLLAQRLKEKKILVGAMRPPTVPNHTARLRIALTVHHTRSDVDRLLDIIAQELFIIKSHYAPS